MSTKPTAPIPLAYDTAIQKHLKPDERLLWVGRPRQGWSYRWHQPFVIFQAMWAVFACWWILNTSFWLARMLGVDHVPWAKFPPPPANVILTVGGLVTAGQLINDRRRRAGTWYAVTDQRMMFVQTNTEPQSMIAVAFEDMTNVRLNERGDPGPNRDKVSFHLREMDPYLCNSNVMGYQMEARHVVLEDLPDAPELFELLRQQTAACQPRDERARAEADALLELAEEHDSQQ